MPPRKFTDDQLRDAMRETCGNGRKAAGLLGVVPCTVLARCRELGIVLDGNLPKTVAFRRRADDILVALHAGETLQQVADRLGVSRQRVHQIVAAARRQS